MQGRYFYLGEWNSAESQGRYLRICAAITEGQSVRDVIAEWSPEIRECVQPAGVSVSQLAEQWLHAEHSGFASPTGRSRGKLHTAQMVERLMVEHWSGTSIADFRPVHLMQLQQHLASKALSRTYIRELINLIRVVFRWGVTMDLVDVTIWQALLAVKHLAPLKSQAVEPRKVDSVPLDRVNATLPHVSETVQRLITFQLLTGCRPGEAIHAQWSEIDRNGPAGCWVYRPEFHKTATKGKAREIAIGPKCQSMLSQLGEARYVFGSDAAPITPSGYRQAVIKGCERAFDCPSELRTRKRRRPEELRDAASKWRAENCWFPYQLRHLAATQIAAAADLEHVAAVLGHSSTNTSRVYVDHSDALLKAASIAAECG